MMFVAAPLAGDGNAGGLHLPLRTAPEAAYTSQQLADIHLLRPKEDQKLPWVKGQYCLKAQPVVTLRHQTLPIQL